MTNFKKILYVNSPSAKPLPHPVVLNIAACGYHVYAVSELEKAQAFLAKPTPLDILLVNVPDAGLLQNYRQLHPAGTAILLTELTMDQYAQALSYQETTLLDHVIAHTDPPSWTINMLRVTLQKLRSTQTFGIDAYLQTGTPTQQHTICDPRQRGLLNQAVSEFAETLRVGRQIAQLAFGISEELLMNALYDAPRDAASQEFAGNAQDFAAPPPPTASLLYGADQLTFAVAVRDAFGSLKKEQFFRYIQKVRRRHEGTDIIDTKQGGAGLGLFKILFSSHALICNCAPDKQTEVIALINLQNPIRDFSKMPRCLHYFSQSLA